MSEMKILFLGLDKAGKTSILLSLQKNTNVLSYCDIKPTKKVDVVELEDQNPSINIWDLGTGNSWHDIHNQDISQCE